MNAPRRSGPTPPKKARPAAVDIRTLLTHREYIKTRVYLLPHRTKVQVLALMERLRRTRRSPEAADNERAPLPEMTDAELVREINWRVGTLPPLDAEDVVRYIEELTRWRTKRRRAGPR